MITRPPPPVIRYRHHLMAKIAGYRLMAKIAGYRDQVQT
jgi:hypothetical protein